MDEHSFGAWLQRRRRTLDLTQVELGQRVGIAVATVRKIEADTRHPSIQVAERMAEALAIPVAGQAAFVRAARGEFVALRDLIALEHIEPKARARSYDISLRIAEQPLPNPLTPLVGRSILIASLCGVLVHPNTRLVTLAGPGGVGKTRLALAVASELRTHAAFADGVVFVSLAAVTTPELVITAIAGALGLRDRGDRPVLDQLLHVLRDQHMALVLDNAEHVLAAAPHLVALLRGAHGLRLLITSRVVLHVAGEQVVTVPPLQLPNITDTSEAVAAAPAIQLFLERAHVRSPARAWSAQEMMAIAAICQQLDGLPLAIELAATRCHLLSPQALLAELSAGPFEALSNGPRDLPARQQTLRATLEWSIHQLPEQEQVLLAGLGLFVGGFTFELARTALGANWLTLNGLASLLDHSLIQSIEGRSGEPRFRLLEVVRRHALESLAASQHELAIRNHWSQTLLALAEQAEQALRGSTQRQCLAWLDTEWPNLNAVLAWALEDNSSSDTHLDLGMRLVAALVPFWWRRGYASQGQRWVVRALSVPHANTATRARLLAQAGRLSWHQGEYTTAITRSEQALALSREVDDTRTAAFALLTLGTVHWFQGRSAAAEQYLIQSLAYAETVGDQWLQAAVCLIDALVAYHLGEHQRRESQLARSLSLSQAIGDTFGIAETLLWSGNIATEHGALEQAKQLYHEAHSHYVNLEDREGQARILHKLADLAHDQNDLEAAHALFDECLAIRHAIGDTVGIAEAKIGLGDVLLKQGNNDGAADCYTTALKCIQARGDQVDRAWALRGLARVARANGENSRAYQLFAESLELAWAQANPWGIAACLDGLGWAIAAHGDPLQAARLFGAADGVRSTNQLHFVPGALPDANADRDAIQAQLGEAAFLAAIATGRATPVDDSISQALTHSRIQKPKQVA